MPALNPGTDDPNASARCPLRLFGATEGPRCRALILVRDAWEHEQWHDALNDALQAPVEVHGGLEVTQWPEHAPEPAPTPIAGPGGL